MYLANMREIDDLSRDDLFLKGLPRRQQKHKKPETTLQEAQSSIYRWWWEYLRLSKDYWLVCQTSTKAMIKTEDQQLRRVYRGFGDIYASSFDDWWLDRGYSLFTEQEKFPKVVEVPRRPTERQRQIPADDRIWIEVPLKLSKRTIQKQLGKLLDLHEQNRLSNRLLLSTSDFKINPAQFGLHTLQKIHEVHALHWELIEKPKWQRKHQSEKHKTAERADLFRIGKLLRLSPSNESMRGEPEEVRARLNRMRVAVSRLLKKSELLIANVELGVFPSYKPVTSTAPRFNARQLAQHAELESKWWDLNLASQLSAGKMERVKAVHYDEPERTRQNNVMLDPRERRVVVRDA
jgi:hypothetical protein